MLILRLYLTVLMESTPTERFLSKMHWNINSKKQEANINMMPPRTTLVPVAQRRSSTLDTLSPPVRSLKTELLDDSSQGSLVISENGQDSNPHRFQPIDENSMDRHEDKSSDDSASRSPVDGMLAMMPAPLKGVDLRLKAQINVNDLADSQPPSMATLLKFGITEQTNMPLPAQSGQSVENYFLTTLENTVNKTIVSNTVASSKTDPKVVEMENKVEALSGTTLNQLLNTEQTVQDTKLFTNQIITDNTQGISEQVIASEMLQPTESHVVNNAQIMFGSVGPNQIMPKATPTEAMKNENIINQLNQNLLTSATPSGNLLLPESSLHVLNNNLLTTAVVQNDTLKNEPNLILSQSISQAGALKTEANIMLSQSLENSLLPTAPPAEVLKSDTRLILSQQSLVANMLPTATPKLDELVNSTVETHIGSPPAEIPTQAPEIVLNSAHPEALLNARPPMLSSTISASSELLIRAPQADMSAPDVILNPQVSPSVMCQDALLGSSLNAICQPAALDACMTDAMQPQRKQPMINVFETGTQNAMLMKNMLIPQNGLEKPDVEQNKQVCPPCPELIPPAITSMSETDLISYINPSCFEGTYAS